MLESDRPIDLHNVMGNHSREGVISLWQYLGSWASRNYESFGKVLFGETWKSTSLLKFDANDNIVIGNMKCVVVELNVSPSTLLNLKYFIKIPHDEIELENMIVFSKNQNL